MGSSFLFYFFCFTLFSFFLFPVTLVSVCVFDFILCFSQGKGAGGVVGNGHYKVISSFDGRKNSY